MAPSRIRLRDRRRVSSSDAPWPHRHRGNRGRSRGRASRPRSGRSRPRPACAAGIGLAIDDFGTGYSAPDCLRRVPLVGIKVDRSFVRRLPVDPASAAIVRAVVPMGARSGVAITVWGMATAEPFALPAAPGRRCPVLRRPPRGRRHPQDDADPFRRVDRSRCAITGAPTRSARSSQRRNAEAGAAGALLFARLHVVEGAGGLGRRGGGDRRKRTSARRYTGSGRP